MDKVITTSLLVIASVVASMALINAVLPAMGKSSGALATANQAAAERIRTDIDIIHATGSTSSNTITVWVKNIGAETIRSVTDTDVILTKPGGVTRLPYQSGCASECWDYSIEGSSTDWSRAVTMRFTLSTSVTTGSYSLSVAVFNAVTASKDFSV